jgi:hypothetical protein
LPRLLLFNVINYYVEHFKLPKRRAVVDAHGAFNNGRWCLVDEGFCHDVQEYINSLDGNYGIIFIHVCNPGGQYIKSRRSMLVFPITTLSLSRQLEYKDTFTIIYILIIDKFINVYNVIRLTDYKIIKR